MPIGLPPYVGRMDPKHPLVDRSYTLRAQNLVPNGATIAGVDVSVTPPGLTLALPPAVNGTNVKVRVAGGTGGVRYQIMFVLSLSDGSTEVAIMIVPVKGAVLV